jgi:kynurenine formamidase
MLKMVSADKRVRRMLSLIDMPRVLVLGILLSVAGAADMSVTRGAETPEPGLWGIYSSVLSKAKYVDLTHAFSPTTPLEDDFVPIKVMPARSARTTPGVIKQGDPFAYETVGAAITAYELTTDQIGTQLDPPAHGNEHGATISDLPPTYAIRPLVIINVADKVRANPGYEATLDDIRAWEGKHGAIPSGSVVMFRTDWSKKWNDPVRFKAKPFPGIQLAVLKYLHLERHILFHGHEPLNTDMSPTYEAESWLFHNNFTQAEGVTNLDQMPESGALIAIGFAKPEGGTGGFARYVGIAPADWPHGVTIESQPGAPLPAYELPLRRGADGVLRSAR